MLEEFESYRENNRLEVKESKTTLPKSLWETYSSFANTQGGVILLGVHEHGDRSLEVIGVNDPAQLKDDFWNTVNNRSKVSACILSEGDVESIDCGGKTVIRIEVPRADRRIRPVYLNDNVKYTYRRKNTGDYRCSMDEVRSLMRDSSEQGQDAHPLPHMALDELCEETVHAYRTVYKQKHDGHPWTKLPDNEFLRVIGAAAEAGDGKLHPTVAGLVMFGQDWRICEEFPDYFLDYRQQLSPGSRWQDRVTSSGGDWTGNAFDFYYRVYNLVKQALRTPFRLEGMYRVDDTPAHRALREALANCLTNASWFERRGVVVLWEPDAIRISNPGGFRIDLGAALRGGDSDPRNRNMLKMFSFINVGERAGSGVPAIVENWTVCGYDTPRWDEGINPDRTMLTLPLTMAEGAGAMPSGANILMHSRGESIPIDAYASLDDVQRTAVKIAADEGRVTTRALAEKAGISSPTALNALKRLTSDGILLWHGTSTRDPHQYYDLPSTPPGQTP